MAHLLRNIVALGCFAGFAAVNGCMATGGPEGGDPQPEAVDTPVGEAQEDVTTAPGGCNINPSPASNPRPGTCAFTICDQIGDTSCCTRSWSGNCVEEALSFCRTPTSGGPLSCQCPHSVCQVGAALDYGCPGSSSFFKQCPALVCDHMPSCCSPTGSWTSACVTAANQYCNRICGWDPPPPGHGRGHGAPDGADPGQP